MNFLLFSNCCFVYMARKGLKIPKGYIRIRKSMKDRQYTDQMKKDKRPKSDLQNTTQKKQDRTTRTSLNNRGVNSGAPKGLAVPSPHVTPVLLLHLQTRWEVLNEEKTGIWLEVEHIYGHLWHRYSVKVSKVMFNQDRSHCDTVIPYNG
jgi:hypothetical protein